MPELLRIKGYLLASCSPPDERNAEAYLSRSVACARRHGALAWELRAATTLAHLRLGMPEARSELGAVYAQFTEGLETADLRAAKDLLDQLARSDEPAKRCQ